MYECGAALRALQHPSIDEAKAFEALTQLAILIRLMTGLEHDLVPLNSDVIERAGIMPFEATELFYVGQEATTIPSIVTSISRQFSRRTNVMQVVAVPLFASFPVYDFFVLHRISHDSWRVAAGYQCKQGTKYPNEDADGQVALSVWLEGKCRKYRVGDDGAHVDMKEETDRGTHTYPNPFLQQTDFEALLKAGVQLSRFVMESGDLTDRALEIALETGKRRRESNFQARRRSMLLDNAAGDSGEAKVTDSDDQIRAFFCQEP